MKATEHKTTGENMHVYEASFLITSAVSEDKIADEFAHIKAALEKAGAEFIAEEAPKFMTLAYTMERTVDSKKHKYNDGYFGWVKFELPVALISNIDDFLSKAPNIFRHLIVKTVRENTLYAAKLAADLKEEKDKADGEAVPAKEIDKSIDALVIS